MAFDCFLRSVGLRDIVLPYERVTNPRYWSEVYAVSYYDYGEHSRGTHTIPGVVGNSSNTSHSLWLGNSWPLQYNNGGIQGSLQLFGNHI